MKRYFRLLTTAACLSVFIGCASYRDSSRDHALPVFQSPPLTIDGLKSPQTRKNQNPNIALALAISGGGHRAANLATGIMLGLERLKIPQSDRSMLEEVDYFSTVSGGGFAAGTYIASLYDHINNNISGKHLLSKSLNEDKGRRLYNLRRDYQISVLSQWFHWKCAGFRDAGDLMEAKFDRHILGSKIRKGAKSIRLGDIFIPIDSDNPVRLPYWIANATIYENGDRFMFSPAFLSKYRVDRYVHNMNYQTLGDDPLSMPLAVGMKASASFPVIFPATTFTCSPQHDALNPYLHLIDGGLTDNLGVKSALELLIADPAPKKMLIIIDAYAKSGHPYSSYKTSPDGAGVAYRIMKIGLDSAHVQHRKNITEHAKLHNIQVHFLNFDELKDKNDESTSPIYRDVMNIPTTLYITAKQQKLLIEAGQSIVKQNVDNLLSLFTFP